MTTKPSTLGNTTFNAILEWIHQVLGNLVQTFNITKTYLDKYDPQSGILSAAAFAILSTTNRLKCYIQGQLVFDRDMILLIKHKVDWELICQKKQAQINKYNIRENNKRVDHDHKVGDRVMFTNNTA